MELIDRQQAIDALNEYFDRVEKLKRRGLNKGEKAIRLDTVGAINSLPSAQPEIKTDGDTISRQAAIDVVNELYQGTVAFEVTYNEVRKAFEALLKQLPSADPQERKIEWIPCSRELPKKNGTYIVKCERSGEQYYDMLDFDATMIAMKWNTTAKVLKWCEIPKEVDNE